MVVSVFGYILANVSTLLSSFNPNDAKKNAKLSEVTEYLNEKGVSCCDCCFVYVVWILMFQFIERSCQKVSHKSFHFACVCEKGFYTEYQT